MPVSDSYCNQPASRIEYVNLTEDWPVMSWVWPPGKLWAYGNAVNNLWSGGNIWSQSGPAHLQCLKSQQFFFHNIGSFIKLKLLVIYITAQVLYVYRTALVLQRAKTLNSFDPIINPHRKIRLLCVDLKPVSIKGDAQSIMYVSRNILLLIFLDFSSPRLVLPSVVHITSRTNRQHGTFTSLPESIWDIFFIMDFDQLKWIWHAITTSLFHDSSNLEKSRYHRNALINWTHFLDTFAIEVVTICIIIMNDRLLQVLHFLVLSWPNWGGYCNSVNKDDVWEVKDLQFCRCSWAGLTWV